MYFGNSWHKFNFVITPEEFEAIFNREDFEFVTNNTRVNIDYSRTEKQEIFSAYKLYYETKKLIFAEVVLSGKVSDEYKLVHCKEPFMNIDPFCLLYKKEKNLLSTIYHEPENVFGLQINYPKTISLADKNDNLRGNYSTEKYAMCGIFKDIIKQIKKISHKAKMMKDDQLLKPDFWISDKAKEQVGQNHYLQENGLVFI